MLKRLEAIRAVMKGDAAKAMDELIGGLGDLGKQSPAPPPAAPAKTPEPEPPAKTAPPEAPEKAAPPMPAKTE